MTIDELITKLEHTLRPNPELDRDIARLVYGTRIPYPSPYTASIDAALALVPDGRHWTLSGGGTATIWRADMTVTEDEHQIEGATPAIALCIAALRARREA